VECQALHNFHAFFAIVGGFTCAPVHRLNIKISTEKAKILESLKAVTDPLGSWKHYRQLLQKMDPPCIPFIGVYQTDLTFIEDGNPKYFQNGLINFKKCSLVATTIIGIQQYQQQPYNLTVVPMIKDFLLQGIKSAEAYNNDALYELSLKIEPRQPSNV